MKKEIIAESGEKSLVIALGEGSEDAFTKIYHAYFRKIYSRIFFLVKDEEQTDELVQELFLKLWTRRAKLDASKSIQAYLFTVAQNLVYDHFRKIAANRRLCHELSLQMSEVYWHTDQLVEEKEQNTVLTRAIESLSPQRKKTFELCKLEGYSYQKASEVLGISHATINTHITHSFKILKNYILKSYC